MDSKKLILCHRDEEFIVDKESRSNTIAVENTKAISVPVNQRKKPRKTAMRSTQGTNNTDGFKNGVHALVQSLHGEKTVVSGVTIQTEVDNKKKRWYHLVDAPPGSIIKIAGIDSATLSEKTLLWNETPNEKLVGFGGVLLWDHLKQNNISEALMELRNK